MQPAETSALGRADGTIPSMQWGPPIAGAIAAAALAFVLFTFGSAIGLSVSSASPTWRDASAALALLSGLYMILAALISFGVGGYIAGRLRARWTAAPADEVEFRDGSHGLLTWGMAVCIGAVLAAATTGGVISKAVPTGASADASAGDSVIAYEIDRLFRSERRAPDADLTNDRAEAGRILLTTSSHSGLAADDRAYLIRLVSSRTGLPAAESGARVDDVIGRSAQSLRRARSTGVILGFSAAAALLLGAVAAWFAAGLGGRHRDGDIVPSWNGDWHRLVNPSARP
jgi:hypothetical protein